MVRRALVLMLSLCAAACSGAELASIGDSCKKDTDCKSGLCDGAGYCAAPIHTLDGQDCKADSDCPTGDRCDTSSGQCYSTESDGKSGHGSCSTDADCKLGEICGDDGKCR
jgi:hypothetical protein